MTAGLLAQHGVFFGDCVGPHKRNPKGYFENKWLKEVYKNSWGTKNFNQAWKQQLKKEGWDGEAIWGAKCGAERWDQLWKFVPDVKAIVCCYRPKDQIHASRADHGFPPNRRTIEYNWGVMQRLADEGLPCFNVWTNKMVKGVYAEIKPAFDKLGIAFDKQIANEWIEPRYWRHG